jgi:hypothetical protein
MQEVDKTPEQNCVGRTVQPEARCTNDLLYVADYIERVEDKSCSYMKRARVYFKNGRSLSVIQYKDSYDGDAGLFEIAPYSVDGEIDGDLFDDDDKGDVVLGLCDVAKVNHYIAKLGTI